MTIKEVVESGVPAQVMFYDGDNMCPGIMIGDKIVCACCGALYEVDEVVSYAREDGCEAILMFPYWVNLAEEVQGEIEDYRYGTTALEMEDK